MEGQIRPKSLYLFFSKEPLNMSTTNTQKQAARQFVKEWSGKGYEKGETQRFWMALLHDVLCVEDPVKAMEFEIPVKTILHNCHHIR